MTEQQNYQCQQRQIVICVVPILLLRELHQRDIARLETSFHSIGDKSRYVGWLSALLTPLLIDLVFLGLSQKLLGSLLEW
ncbi:Uncharacterised protein [Mannheimia haemolytica]|uniref:Uncharacterized protein n=1 Tax=Mannheimia haemolytica TaxID=75985 RepID=A0A378N7Q4_MANHA|nr:Uncharacterised protein [Mannheimia haemolytica]